MSTRPVAASIRGVKVVVMPPCRMNVPSCAVRTRSTLGLNVTVSVTTDTRDALLIETGTVYGPPATRNSVPGGVTSTCATPPVGAGAPGGAAGVVVTSRGGTVPAEGVVAPAAGAVAG